MTMHFKGGFLAAAICVALAGCGGGGGSGTTTASGGSSSGSTNLTSAPLATALGTYSQASHSATLNGTSGGTTYTATYTYTPNSGTTTFNGNTSAYSATTIITVSQGGTVLSTQTSTSYFAENPYADLGATFPGGTPYEVVTSYGPLPATVGVGDSGTLESATWYHDSTMATVDANSTDSYTVQANNSSTLQFCDASQMYDVTAQGTADGLAAETDTVCYTIDATGNVSLQSVTIIANGTSITFQ